jgi:hypothetical protein
MLEPKRTMSGMKNRISQISRLFALSIGLTLLASIAMSGLSNAQDNRNQGIPSFKVPDGYMQAQMSDFRGIMLLDPKRPAGMFVTFGNDNETSEALSQRILVFVAPMFIHDESAKAERGIAWVTRTLPPHPDDGAGKAAVNYYSSVSNDMQVAIYQRTHGSRAFLYGYFAMRHKPGQGDDGKFLDEQGKGVKAFDKLWKSFSK